MKAEHSSLRAKACNTARPNLIHRARGTLLAAAIIAVTLSACATHRHREERPQKYPENYKAELVEFLQTYLNDPTKIRDAAITDPMLKSIEPNASSGNTTDAGGTSGGDGQGAGDGRRRWGGRGGQFGGNSAFSGDRKRERYVVCVRYNAKDRDGRYAGVKQGAAIYADGRFDGFREQPQAVCDEAEFKPFPELENLRR